MNHRRIVPCFPTHRFLARLGPGRSLGDSTEESDRDRRGGDDVPTDPGGRPRRSRWSSFVADSASDPPRILHEEGNPGHRLRVEHDQQTLLIHLSDEDGPGWTVFAVERQSRKWAVAQGQTQVATARRAYTELYGSA
jgi:hypothetical protein